MLNDKFSYFFVTRTDDYCKLAIKDRKLYVHAVKISGKASTNLMQIEIRLKENIILKTISKVSTQGLYHYLDYLIDPSVQGANRFLVLSFENALQINTQTKIHKQEIARQ